MSTTENEVAASDRAHLMELFIALRRLPPRMGHFWDVAYGRAHLAVLGEDSIRSTWIEERALRVKLALVMIVPEPHSSAPGSGVDLINPNPVPAADILPALPVRKRTP